MMSALTGCGPTGQDENPPSPTTTGGHDPNQGEIESLRRQLHAIDGVQSIPEFDYQAGIFGDDSAAGATFTGTVTASEKDLVKILDTAYRLTWFRTDIAMGVLIYVV